MPPAFVTAAASLGPAATFMPASMTGCLIFSRSVSFVRICSAVCQRCDVAREEVDIRGDAMLGGGWLVFACECLENLREQMEVFEVGDGKLKR
jgi:hypothetical protein